MSEEKILKIEQDLQEFLPAAQIYTTEIERTAYSVDASMFERTAQAVVDILNEDELIALLNYASKEHIGITFRANGTSLNGQCSGEGILARIRGDFWNKITVGEDGENIRSWCGVLGSDVNAQLQKYGKMIGPDPASMASAYFGGIIANNAAGMCCTTEQNAYATLGEMRLILANGTILDTADKIAIADFRRSHKDLLAGLLKIRNELLADSETVEKIEQKYRIKNTCGYAVNAFIDFADPVDILTHLMVGSEGSLGFVSNASLSTFPTHSHRATALLFFPDLETAIEAVTRWLGSDAASAAELFDGPTLQAMAKLPVTPEIVQSIDAGACSILIEARANSENELQEKVSSLQDAIKDITTLTPVEFFTDNKSCEGLWAFRRALFSAVAGNRDPNELVLIEDICFPVDKLAEGIKQVGDLFAKYQYGGGIQGHAFHGNFHFAIPVDFSTDTEVEKIHTFLKEVMDVVLSFDGSLKAEHGTGFTIAPFVELEWGEKIYQAMKKTKELLDPAGILNPGVLINNDPLVHTKKLKSPRASHPILDDCVECGFCEPVCPSAKISLSPRQRVSLWRHIAVLRQTDPKKAQAWEKEYDKMGTELCATDALCTKRCPLQIDVAGFVRDRRSILAPKYSHKCSSAIGKNLKPSISAASAILDGVAIVQKILGDAFMYKAAGLAEKITGPKLPTWNREMPRGGKKITEDLGMSRNGDSIVFMPSCAIRTMGDSLHHPSEPLADVIIRLIKRAGYNVIIPENVDSLCCGKAFETKGLFKEADAKVLEMERALLKASYDGRLPILCETSPCLARMKKTMHEDLHLYEPIEFAEKFLLNKLKVRKSMGKIAIHPTCSTRAMGLDTSFYKLAQQCADEVVWPQDIQCCGFSGDKGLSHPHLNAASLATLQSQIEDCEEGYSTSRTCEIGLSLHGGIGYKNVLYLLEKSLLRDM